MKTFWLCVVIVLWFVPSYAHQYFDYRRTMQRLTEQQAHYDRMEALALEGLEHTKRTNAEFLRLTRQKLGLEKAL